MKDNGIVISTEEDLAQVEVNCFEACQNCSAQGLCIGKSSSKGLLDVKNPLKACRGDEVQIEIPESKYTRMLIFLFGILLSSCLAGMAAGYIFSLLLPIHSQAPSIIGLFLGLSLGAFGLIFAFNKKNKEHLYPVITDIIQKGGCHG